MYLKMYEMYMKCVEEPKAQVGKAGLDPVLASHYQNHCWLLVCVTKWEGKEGKCPEQWWIKGEQGIKEDWMCLGPPSSEREREKVCARRPPLLPVEKHQLQTQPVVPGLRWRREPAGLWCDVRVSCRWLGERTVKQSSHSFIPCPSEVFSESHPNVWIRRANTRCIFCLETQSLCLQNTSLACWRVTLVSISCLLNWGELASSQVTFKGGRHRFGWEGRAAKTGEKMLHLGQSCSAFGLLPVMPSLCPEKKNDWPCF